MSSLSVLLTALLDHPADDDLRARLRAELLHAGGWDWPALLGFVLDHPAADGPRLLAADWLADHGEEDRAEFVRAQCRLLQMLDVYVALANNGVSRQPRLLAATIDADGTRHSLPLGTTRQVVSPETATMMRDMLTGVVAGGTGVNAQVPGYTVAGKTGTARKPPYDHPPYRYVSSFVGFASSFCHSSRYFGSSYARPRKSSIGERTGHWSQYITSCLCGHFDLSAMYG